MVDELMLPLPLPSPPLCLPWPAPSLSARWRLVWVGGWGLAPLPFPLSGPPGLGRCGQFDPRPEASADDGPGGIPLGPWRYMPV